jgi:uncharacterized membrane protein YgaE (UPF0421/DUF939 family)
MFSKNVGSIDRALRIIVGIGLLAAFFVLPGSSPWHYAYLIGIVPLVTGLMSSCPLYSIFGISTCRVDQR